MPMPTPTIRGMFGPTLDDLITAATTLGVAVQYARLTRSDGYWDQATRTITLDRDLTGTEARAVLAHELTHAARGDAGPQPHVVEEVINQHVARLLIDSEQYALAEVECDGELAGIADWLDAPQWLVYAYRDWLNETVEICRHGKDATHVKGETP